MSSYGKVRKPTKTITNRLWIEGNKNIHAVDDFGFLQHPEIKKTMIINQSKLQILTITLLRNLFENQSHHTAKDMNYQR